MYVGSDCVFTVWRGLRGVPFVEVVTVCVPAQMITEDTIHVHDRKL